MATSFACLQNGLLYILLPILGSTLFGLNGMWAGFVIAPILTLCFAMCFVYLRFGKDNFPFILKSMESEIEVMDNVLTPENSTALSEQVRDSILSHNYSNSVANHAALFVEELGSTILEVNEKTKKPVLIELSLFFKEDSVLIILRDSGELFDATDPNLKVKGLSSFVLNGLMKAQKEKEYLVTTGYNRNIIRFKRTDNV